jgi:hypothetical protein
MFYSTNNAYIFKQAILTDSFKRNCFYLKHLLLRHNFLHSIKSENNYYANNELPRALPCKGFAKTTSSETAS